MFFFFSFCYPLLSFRAAWALNAAATAVPTVRLWTDSLAPDRETLLPLSTAADLMMSSTAAMIPTVFSRMSTDTCGGWGKRSFHTGKSLLFFSSLMIIFYYRDQQMSQSLCRFSSKMLQQFDVWRDVGSSTCLEASLTCQMNPLCTQPDTNL